MGQGQRGYFEEVIDTTVEQATQTRRTATQLADDIATRNELALAFANKACDACNDPEVIKRFIGKADNAIRRISDTGLDPDATAQALREAIDDFSPEAAEAFLDDLNNVSPARATELLDQYACGIGIQSQAGSSRGCSKTLGNRLKTAFGRPNNHQAHHLIPAQLGAGGSLVHPMVARGQLDTLWDINGISNGEFFPDNDTLSIAVNKPKHRGSHRKLTTQVRDDIEDAWIRISADYEPYYNVDLNDFTEPLPVPQNLPSGLPPLEEAIQTELDRIADEYRVRLRNLGGGTTVNNL